MTAPSILVVAERSGDPQSALQKASVLARHLGADLELFTCDVEHAWAVAQQARSADARLVVDACLADSTRYLAALRGTVAARDLVMRTSAVCAPSLYEGLARRSEEVQPLLVVKGCTETLCRGPGVILRPDELRLIREPPAPLLLSRGRTWAPVPRIGALVVEPADTARLELPATELAQRCHGEFEWLSLEVGQSVEHAVAQRRIDVLAMLATATRQGGAQSPLPEELIGNLACDLLVVLRESLAPGALLAAVAIRTDHAHR